MIRQYLVGVCVNSVGVVYLFRHMSNVAIEVLHRVLPTTLYLLQLDNYWRKNKNRFVFAYLSDLVSKVLFHFF